MPPLNTLKRRLFWVVSKICFTLYRQLPVFGTLRASLGIIQRDGRFLIIHRNDGRGLCLPGGISSRGEAREETLRREIREETGLTVTAMELRLEYFSDADVPCNISLYEVQAEGEPQESWEGAPRWTTLTELEPRLLPSQRKALEVLGKMAEGTQGCLTPER